MTKENSIDKVLEDLKNKFDKLKGKANDEQESKQLQKQYDFYRVGLKRIDKILVLLRSFNKLAKGSAYYYTEDDVSKIFEKFENELVEVKEALLKKIK